MFVKKVYRLTTKDAGDFNLSRIRPAFSFAKLNIGLLFANGQDSPDGATV